ncbi:UvrD-helicase domain-containing protein, partial [Escherichia coli]
QKHSFLLYAGAGSGKTRTLVNVLEMILKSHSEEFRLRGKKIAVITYTNAACDEIKRRVKFNKLIDVSTIHSFLWELIRHHSSDIKSWLMENIAAEIADLRDKQSRTTRVSQASLERERKIVSKEKRLQNLSDVYKFTYNPTGDNRTKDSLN